MPELQAMAEAAVASLSEAVRADLDENGGGFGWWSDYNIKPADRFDLSDYLVGVIEGVRTHLRIADTCLSEYRQKRATDDFQLRAWSRANPSEPVWRGMSLPDANKRDDLMSAHVYGFFNAASSVLDTLAGTVLGVAGLNLPLVRADLSMFAPITSDPDYPIGKRLIKALIEDPEGREAQLVLVRAFRTSLLQAGPADWHQWLNQKRNQLAHRGGRLKMVNFVRERGNLNQCRNIVFERDPDLTTTQSFRSPDLGVMWLQEDQETTMNGILGSLQASVVGTLAPSRLLWDRRRNNPALIPQPATQWTEPNGTLEFPGYNPRPELFNKVAAMIVHPAIGARLTASKVLRDP